MKKVVFIGLFLFVLAIALAISFVFNKEDYVQLDLVENSDPKAAEILYNHTLKTTNLTAERAKNEFNFSKENFFAVYFDLNDDGEEEIIGFANTTFFCGTAGCGLDILQKDKNGYKDISYLMSIQPAIPILLISNKKTNRYRNIKLFFEHYTKTYTLKYKNRQYVNKEQIEELEQVFKEHSKVMR